MCGRTRSYRFVYNSNIIRCLFTNIVLPLHEFFFAVGKCLVDKRKALAKADECLACGDSCEAEEDEAVVDEK